MMLETQEVFDNPQWLGIPTEASAGQEGQIRAQLLGTLSQKWF